MKRQLKRGILIGVAFALAGQGMFSQLDIETTENPDEVRFVYDDLHNFLEALRMIEAGSDLSETLKKTYLDKASPALNNYLEDQGLGHEDFVDSYPRFRRS